MRVLIAEDNALLRAGLVEVLTGAGIDVIGNVGDGEQLLALLHHEVPDAVVLDIRMPPTHTTEGLEAARIIRSDHPGVAILLLSQHVETHHATELIAGGAAGIGYLLKDRILDPAELDDALRRITSGGSAIDPAVIERLVRRRSDPVDALTDREREVLAAMAQGRSNQWIAANLFISAKTVEAHTSRIFTKLGLTETPDDHRRVLAVLEHLRGGRGRT
ncbi:MAG TPA: response regulator transcription factor [Acidimicrobiales bacterium]|nr:response regulator transcription factor [Acidimicrobiales bacterium]